MHFSANRALLFWKCWKSKFDLGNKCTEVDGCVDVHDIAEKFAAYIEKCYSCNNVKQQTTLESEYSRLRANYAGFPTANEPVFDTELVSKIICNLKLGKAADIDGLTGEHLLHSHPILHVIISRLLCRRPRRGGGGIRRSSASVVRPSVRLSV